MNSAHETEAIVLHRFFFSIFWVIMVFKFNGYWLKFGTNLGLDEPRIRAMTKIQVKTAALIFSFAYSC